MAIITFDYINCPPPPFAFAIIISFIITHITHILLSTSIKNTRQEKQ